MSERNEDVAAALAILRDAGFPVERIRVLPAEGRRAKQDDGGLDRVALLRSCLAALADGESRSANDLADRVQKDFEDEVTKRQVNSVLSREGQGQVLYDRDTYTYRLRA